VQVSEQPLEPVTAAEDAPEPEPEPTPEPPVDASRLAALRSPLGLAGSALYESYQEVLDRLIARDGKKEEPLKAVEVARFDGVSPEQQTISIEPVLFKSATDTEDLTFLGFGTGVTAEDEGGGVRYGEVAIDANATAEKLAKARAAQIAEMSLNESGVRLTPAQAKALYFQELPKAKADVSAWYQATTSRGEEDKALVSFGLTPGSENLKHWTEGSDLTDREAPFYRLLSFIPEGEARETIAPFLGLYEGAELTSRTGTGIRTYNEQAGVNWGFMSWAGRMSLDTLAANYAGVDGEADWGGPEMMRSIARGEDLFTLFDKLESKAYDEDAGPVRQLLGTVLSVSSGQAESAIMALDKVSEVLLGKDLVTPEGAEVAGDFVVAAALTLKDPDIWMALGRATRQVFAGATKVADNITPIMHINETTAALEAAAERRNQAKAAYQSGALTSDDLFDVYEEQAKALKREGGPGLGLYFDAMFASLYGKNLPPHQAVQESVNLLNETITTRAAKLKASEDTKALYQQAAEKLNEAQDAAMGFDRAAEVKLANRFKQKAEQLKNRLTAVNKAIGVKRTEVRTASPLQKSIRQRELAGLEARAGRLQSSIKAFEEGLAAKKANVKLLDAVETLRQQTTVRGKQLSAKKLNKRQAAKLKWRQTLDEETVALTLKADLLDTIQGLTRLTVKGRKGTGPRMPQSELVARLEASTKDLLTNPQYREDSVARAGALLQYNKLMQEATVASNEGVLVALKKRVKALDRKIKKLGQTRKEAKQEMGPWAAPEGKRPGLGTKAREVWEAEKAHASLVKALQKVIKRDSNLRAIAAFDIALDRTLEVYKATQKQGIRRVSAQGVPAQVKAVQRLNEEFYAADQSFIRRNMNKARTAINELAAPVQQITGSSSAQFNNIYMRQSNTYNQAVIDIKAALREAEEGAATGTEVRSRSKAMVDYMDDMQARTASTSVFTESPFGAARAYVKAEADMVDSLGKEASKVLPADEQLVTGFSRMWLVNLDRGLSANQGAQLKAFALDWFRDSKNAQKGSKDFAEDMLVQTVRVLSGERGRLGTELFRKLIKERRQAAGSRAYGKMALSSVAAASMQKSLQGVAKAVAFPPGLDLRLLDAWSKNEPQKIVQGYEQVVEAMVNLGLPVKIQREAQESGNALAAGMTLFETTVEGKGTLVPMPTRWVRQTAKKVGTLVNSLDQYTVSQKNPLNYHIGQTLKLIWTAWQASVLMGSALVRPKYLTMMGHGTAGQVYVEAGLVDAVKAGMRYPFDVSASGLKHLPFVGRALDQKYGEAIAGGLPSPMGSLISTQTSMIYDFDNFPGNKVWGELDGKEKTFAEIRAEMVRQGVFSSFVSASAVRDIIARTIPQRIMSSMGAWTDGIASFVQHIEERMRVNQYLERRVNAGDSEQVAGALVRAANYDWDAPMARLEEDYFRHWFLFWPFVRRALGQYLRALTDPTFGLENKASRIARYDRIQSGSQKMFDKYLEEHFNTDPTNYPPWTSEVTSRSYFGLRGMPAKMRTVRGASGKPVTHVMYSMPSATHVGSAQLVGHFYRTLRALLALDPEQASKESIKTLKSVVGPRGELTVKAIEQTLGMESNAFSQEMGPAREKKPVVLLNKPTELYVFHALHDWLPWEMGPDIYEEGGRSYVPKSAYAFYKYATPVSVELASLLDPAVMTYQDQRSSMYLMRQLTGMFSETEIIAPYQSQYELEKKTR
jgi:hypothetical protein